MNSSSGISMPSAAYEGQRESCIQHMSSGAPPAMVVCSLVQYSSQEMP
jgi:hypothetical protein